MEKKVVTTNRKAFHDYTIFDKYVAGIVLTGTEIKSIRLGKVSINDSYCDFKDNEMFIINMHISLYDKGNIFNHQVDSTRKLLLHKKETLKISNKIVKEGYTIIPLRVVIRNGLAKVDIGIAKGKKLYDKREDIKKKEMQKEANQ